MEVLGLLRGADEAMEWGSGAQPCLILPGPLDNEVAGVKSGCNPGLALWLGPTEVILERTQLILLLGTR